MRERGYQYGYSDLVPVVLNEVSRREKGEKIIRVLRDFFGGRDTSAWDCLDVGCSGGVIDDLLAPLFRRMIGVDIDHRAVARAVRDQTETRARFAVADALNLPFPEGSFDVVICNHVYAHVPDPVRMMDEIFRVLKPGGACYFAAGNRLNVIEGNYRLPFLSWLPGPLADVYLKTFRGLPKYHERHMTHAQLKRLTRRFRRVDYTLEIIRRPGDFGYDLSGFQTGVYGLVASTLFFLVPTYVWMLVKEGGAETRTS